MMLIEIIVPYGVVIPHSVEVTVGRIIRIRDDGSELCEKDRDTSADAAVTLELHRHLKPTEWRQIVDMLQEASR